MSVLACALVCAAAAPATAGSLGAPFAPALTGPTLVRLAWTDPAGLRAAGWRLSLAETGRVLARLGLQISSRSARPAEATGPDEVRVVLVPGAPPRADGRTVLGSASTAGPHRDVWVFCDGVARLLGARVPFRPLIAAPEDVVRFDRVVGRVVAHEVVHLLAPGLPHGTGLMAACADAREFVAPSMRIDPALAALVQDVLQNGGGAMGARRGPAGEVAAIR